MSKELREKLIYAINNDKIEEVLSSLSVEEKLTIIDSRDFFAKTIRLKCEEMGLFIINSSDILQNFNDELFQRTIFSRNVMDYCDFPEEIDEYVINAATTNNELYKKVKNRKTLINYLKSIDEDSRFYIYDQLTDEELEGLLQDKFYKNEYRFIVERFRSADLRRKYINLLPKDDRAYLVATLGDEVIKQNINGFSKNKGILISSLKNDKEKDAYLNHYRLVLNKEDKADIISSFSNQYYIEKNFHFITNDTGREKVLWSASNVLDDNFKKRIIDAMSDDEILAGFLGNEVLSEELRIYIMDKIKDKSTFITVFFNFDEDSLMYKEALKRIGEKDAAKYIKKNMGTENHIQVLMACNDENLIIEALTHEGMHNPYSDEMAPLFRMVANHYNLNFDHLVKLAKITSVELLSQLTNKNIRDAINLDEENFNKYLAIFDEKNIKQDMSKISSVLSFILQREFTIKYPEEIEIFIRTLRMVQDGNQNEAIQNIYSVCQVVDLTKFNTDMQTLINGVLSLDQNYIVLFNKITREYLKLKRNEYVNENMKNALLDTMDYQYDNNDLPKYIINNLPTDMIISVLGEYENGKSMFKDLLNNKDLLRDLIEFKKHPADRSMSLDMKKNIKSFNSLMALAFQEALDYCDYNPEIKTEFIPKTAPNSHYLEIMLAMNTDRLKETVLSNNEVYTKLMETLSRYGVVGFGYEYNNVSKNTDLEFYTDTIAELISNYGKILEKKNESERFTFEQELDYASCLNSDASIYSKLFGFEDFMLLRRNPAPNRSPLLRKERIDKAVKFMKSMHDRKYITVPPIDEDIPLSNGKDINVMVGNTNDMINLTYGERTGACMRIGGAGKSLFEFCLTNENGFHISFNDPKTGKLVSRISCFRNGNTIFMNQLRDSLNEVDFSNQDLCEACRKVGQLLIEKTKDSKYPIENVVADNSYAYGNANTRNINCSNIQKGLPKFYCDVSENAVIVATSGETLAPVKTGPRNVERYSIGRAKIRKYEGNKAENMVHHIEVSDKFFDGVDLDDIEVIDKGVKLAYVGEDWYAALLENNQIINYVEQNSLNKSAAMEEMNNYIKILQNELYMEMDGGMKL